MRPRTCRPSDLARQVEEAREWEGSRPPRWWVSFDVPPQGIFAEGMDRVVVARTLYDMRAPVRPAPTDRDDCEFYPLDTVERLVVDERDMPAVMRCVRLTGLHGTYREAGTDKEYRF